MITLNCMSCIRIINRGKSFIVKHFSGLRSYLSDTYFIFRLSSTRFTWIFGGDGMKLKHTIARSSASQMADGTVDVVKVLFSELFTVCSNQIDCMARSANTHAHEYVR